MKISVLAGLVAVLILSLFPLLAAPGTNEHTPKPPAKSPSPGMSRVQVEEFEKLWKDKKNIVLDVRTQKEFNAGHIPGATNLDVNLPDFEKKISTLDKDKVYLVHCAVGVRSARACEKMGRLGFRHLIDLAPGFKGWEKAGKTIEK